jgi:hypothetical protein
MTIDTKINKYNLSFHLRCKCVMFRDNVKYISLTVLFDKYKLKIY